MFKKGILKVKKLWLQVSAGYQYLNRFIKTNLLANRLFFFLLTIVLLGSSIFLGLHHKNKDEYIKAMTVSDINQSLSFSQTGTEFQLYPQSRNKDVTIIPFKLSNTEQQSVDAKDYLVSLMPITRERLNKDISTSILFFGTNGEGSIVIKGKLPKEPLSVTIRDNSNIATKKNGSGTLLMNGVEQEVSYNGVSFTINPKAKNVKKKETINTDMPITELYNISFANKQFNDIEKAFNGSVKKEKTLNNKLDDLMKRVKRVNKTLGKDENDFTYDNSVDDSEDNRAQNSVSTSDLDDAASTSTDISNTDIENIRNSAVDEMEKIYNDIESENDTQEGLKAQQKQLQNFTNDKIYDLTSMNSNTEIRSNDKPK